MVRAPVSSRQMGFSEVSCEPILTTRIYLFHICSTMQVVNRFMLLVVAAFYCFAQGSYLHLSHLHIFVAYLCAFTWYGYSRVQMTLYLLLHKDIV